jgi:type II restriction enzyme
VFVFGLIKIGDITQAVGWVATSLAEETLIETWLGEEVEPGEFYLPVQRHVSAPFQDIPDAWHQAYPSGQEIFDFVLHRIPGATWSKSLDTLLLKRRETEFALYRSLEESISLPRIKEGFDSVDDFIQYALSISNRRKSRAGRSLELNLEAVFRDEKLCFESQAPTENGKKPDFLFPSAKAYHSRHYPTDSLHLVAAKTTTKDRWRQVIDEADRIRLKHLFTLQQGVSPRQLEHMQASGIRLVVPEPYLKAYPPDWRNKILTLEQLIRHIRVHQSAIGNMEQWTA